MTPLKAYRRILLIAASVLCMANSECDTDYSCEGACLHSAQCEDEWLAEDGAAPMNDGAYAAFINSCVDHCRNEGTYEEIGCVESESCDRLRDGKCSE